MYQQIKDDAKVTPTVFLCARLHLVRCVNCKYMLCMRAPHCLTPAYSPTCLTANPAPASESQRQRALITLVLRGLTRSIQSHCSIQYNHGHLLMRGRKRQTEKRRGRRENWLRSVGFLGGFSAKWNCILDLSS